MWMKTDRSVDFDSLYKYAYHTCKSIFQKARAFQYITLLKGDNSIFSLTCHKYLFFSLQNGHF